jgi:hypothetical protein
MTNPDIELRKGLEGLLHDLQTSRADNTKSPIGVINIGLNSIGGARSNNIISSVETYSVWWQLRDLALNRIKDYLDQQLAIIQGYVPNSNYQSVVRAYGVVKEQITQLRGLKDVKIEVKYLPEILEKLAALESTCLLAEKEARENGSTKDEEDQWK